MKQLKKLLMVLMCAGVLMSVTACGSDNNAEENGMDAAGTTNEGTGSSGSAGSTERDDASAENPAMNDATGGSEAGKENGGGVLDQAAEDVKDGAEDLAGDVEGSQADNHSTGSQEKTN